MMEEQFKDELMQRRAKMQQQVELLQKQIRAYDVMLAGLPHGILEPPPELAPPAPQSPLPGAAVPPPSPEAPVVRKPCFDPTPDELAEIAELADSTRRGRGMAKVELAIVQCGDTFSLTEILDVFKTQYGWRGVPDQRAIALALWKVVRRRGYRLVRQGAGRTSSVYSKY